MTEWIIPCNPNQYDIEGAFCEFDRIEWKQGNNYEVGDHIYIYVSGDGHHRIEYLCAVTRTGITERSVKDKKYILNGEGFLESKEFIELVRIEKFDTHLLRYVNLEENGLKGNIQRPMRILDPVLSSYIYASTTTRLDQKPNKGPDSDHTLKEIILILLKAFNTAVPRKYLSNIIYPIGKNVPANLTVPIQQLVSDGKIVRHEDDTLQLVSGETPNYYLVFQNRTYDKESKNGYLIANKNKDGLRRIYWDNMQQVKKGDIIFHYKDQYCVAVSEAVMDCGTKDKDANGREAWFIRTDYYTFPHPIKPRDYWQLLKPLQPEKYAPFNKNGTGNQGYLYAITEGMARVILEATAGLKTIRSTGEPEEVPELSEEDERFFKSEDDLLQEELNEDPMDDTDENFEYSGKPKLRKAPIDIKGRKSYPREVQTSKNALAHAHFKCEIDQEHHTFVKKNSNKQYTEAHHLVPMAYSDMFGVSLDVEENIVSLCCTCHRRIHFGIDAENLIRELYEKRKEILYRAGISVSIDELLKMYKL